MKKNVESWLCDLSVYPPRFLTFCRCCWIRLGAAPFEWAFLEELDEDDDEDEFEGSGDMLAI